MLVFWGSLVISQRVLVTYENIFMKTERRGGREGWKEEESVNSTWNQTRIVEIRTKVQHKGECKNENRPYGTAY